MRSPRTLVAAPLVGAAIALTSWEVAAQPGLWGSSSFPSFHDAASAAIRLIGEAEFVRLLSQTLRAWALGLMISVGAALPCGVALGLIPGAYRIVRVPLEALRPVPPIVILPLALLVLGGGTAYQSLLIVQGAFWSLLVSIVYAVRSTDQVLIDTARSFHLGALRSIALVRLPAALPLVLSALRIAAATAFAVTIVSEMLGGASGIGTRLMIAQSGGDSASVYAVTLIAGSVGLVIAVAFGAVERRFSAWRAT